MTVPFPFINGNRKSWSSVECNVNGSIIKGVKEISYSSSLEPGEQRGTHAQKAGRTRGELKPEASITFYQEDYDDLIAALGDGYMEKDFPITVSYSELNSSTRTDRLIGCRIKKADNSYSSGTDALVVKCDLDVMYIIENGVHPILNAQGVST